MINYQLYDFITSLFTCVAYLGAGAAVFFALKNPEMQKWLTSLGVIMKSIIFIILTYWVGGFLNSLFYDLYSMIRNAIEGDWGSAIGSLLEFFVFAIILIAGVVLALMEKKKTETAE